MNYSFNVDFSVRYIPGLSLTLSLQHSSGF